jgi:hypothetical protein
VIGSVTASITYILEELRARIVWPLGENENRNASAPGKAAEELAFTDIRLIRVWRGRKYASNRLRRTSAANLVFRRYKSNLRNGPVMTVFDKAYDGHRDRWWA